nr:HBS1-like protein isoform X1 [Ipomoea batatas]
MKYRFFSKECFVCFSLRAMLPLTSQVGKPLLDEVVSKAKVKRDTSKLGVWRCPICTFDNEDSMSACDICGVLRNPLVKGSRDSSTKVGTSRDSEASKLAKSLFASLLQQNPKKAVTFEGKSDVFKSEEPFKFDTPSLDDMVSGGIHSSRVGSKATSNKILQSNASSGKDEMMTGAKAELIAGGSSTPIAKFGPNEIKQSASSQNSSKQGLSKSMKNLSVSSKSQSTEKGSIHDNVEDKLSQLNLAVVGHVDSGKSTLSGRLLHMLGHISRKDMHKNEKEAKQLGKGSFAYAWALDESAEERERGITMNVAVAFFNTKNYHVVLLDSPGHRDFVPNMISGATQADAAILVVDASMGAFEAGIDASGGQTREHALLIKSFGVDQIIVAVNKMDSVQYSKERFDAIKKQLGTFLRTCKFKDSSIVWIPISAMENQNLFTGPSDAQFLSWYQGSSLVDAIDSLQPLVRDYSKPLLMPICDIVKSQSQGHVSVCGKLETGSLQTGFKVLVMPTREIATVRSLERNLQVCRSAKAGDNVTVNLQGIDGNRVMAGGVLCDIDYPVPVTNHLELKVVTLDISTPVLVGSQVAAKVVKLLSLLDPKTGKETKKSPRCLLSKQNAIIEVALQLPVCVDEYASCKSLGRVSFRVLGRTIALGLVTKVLEQM